MFSSPPHLAPFLPAPAPLGSACRLDPTPSNSPSPPPTSSLVIFLSRPSLRAQTPSGVSYAPRAAAAAAAARGGRPRGPTGSEIGSGVGSPSEMGSGVGSGAASPGFWSSPPAPSPAGVRSRRFSNRAGTAPGGDPDPHPHRGVPVPVAEAEADGLRSTEPPRVSDRPSPPRPSHPLPAPDPDAAEEGSAAGPRRSAPGAAGRRVVVAARPRRRPRRVEPGSPGSRRGAVLRDLGGVLRAGRVRDRGGVLPAVGRVRDGDDARDGDAAAAPVRGDAVRAAEGRLRDARRRE